MAPKIVTPAAEVVQPTGPSWQSVTLVVAPILIAAVVSIFASGFAYFAANDAKQSAGEAVVRTKETHDLVNSRLSEILPLIKKGAADAATLEEKTAQKLREANISADTAKVQSAIEDAKVQMIITEVKRQLQAEAKK